MKKLLFLLLFFLPMQASAAVTYDASVDGGATATSPQTFTLTTSGSNIDVDVLVGCSTHTNCASAVTVGGVSATAISGVDSPTNLFIEHWVAVGVPAGTETISVTHSAATVQTLAASYNGAGSVGASNTNGPSSGTGITGTLNTTVDGSLVAGGFVNSTSCNTCSAGSNTTLLVKNNGNAVALTSSPDSTPAGSYTQTLNGPSDSHWAVSVIEIEPFSGGGGGGGQTFASTTQIDNANQDTMNIMVLFLVSAWGAVWLFRKRN